MKEGYKATQVCGWRRRRRNVKEEEATVRGRGGGPPLLTTVRLNATCERIRLSSSSTPSTTIPAIVDQRANDPSYSPLPRSFSFSSGFYKRRRTKRTKLEEPDVTQALTDGNGALV